MTALGSDTRRGKQIDALLLIQAANNDLELWRSPIVPLSRKFLGQLLLRRWFQQIKASIAFCVIAKLPLRFPAVTGNLSDRNVRQRRMVNGKLLAKTGTPLPAVPPLTDEVAGDIEGGQQPIKTKFLEVSLRDLDKLRLDLDLLGSGNIRLFNERIY